MRVSLYEHTGASMWLLDLSGLAVKIECGCFRGRAVLDVAAFVEQHGHYPTMIFDVGLVTADGACAGAFEIVKSNPLTDAKRGKIIAAGLFCVCVDAYQFNQKDGYVQTARIAATQIVLSPAGRKRIRCMTQAESMRMAYNDNRA